MDANVYVSALIRPEGTPGQIIERFLSREAFDIVVTPTIVEEIERALAYPKVRKYVRPGVDASLWLENIMLLADVVPGDLARPGVTTDPDDDKYVAAAVEGRATLVVTGDPDLLAVDEHEGVRIVSPRAFLDLLAAR